MSAREYNAKYKELMKLWIQLWGVTNLSYNLHSLRHMHEVRSRAGLPCTAFSAFANEGSYSKIRYSFMPGSTSVPLQALMKTNARLMDSAHLCDVALTLGKVTNLRDDRFVYCNGSIYRTEEIVNEDHTIYGQRLRCIPFEVGGVDLGLLGCYRLVRREDEWVQLNTEDIQGKAMGVRYDDDRTVFVVLTKNMLVEGK